MLVWLQMDVWYANAYSIFTWLYMDVCMRETEAIVRVPN